MNRPLVLIGVSALAVVAAIAAWRLVPRGAAAAAATPEVADAIARSAATNPAAWRRKVIVLGFDSCDPDLVDQMIRDGKLPNFARLRREGASGFLETTQPPLSPVVWTSIATGMPPERHGILDFVKDTPGAASPIAPVTSEERQADTVWEILSRHGEQVGVVGWLVTFPAEPLNGFIVTDRMGLLAFDYGRELDPDLPRRTWPEELAREVEKDRVTVDDLPLWKVRPFADVGEQEYRDAYSTRFNPVNPLGNLRLTLATAETFRAAGERLYDERKPRFFALYFEAMDALSHLFMRYAPPKMPDVDEREYMKYRTAIEANYVWHDRVLGEFLDRADADTTLYLVSDHGFRSGDYRRNDRSDFHAKTGAMWHRNYGVFFAWGAGVARGARVDGATVFDIAPTILASMGYPKPKDMPGRVLSEAFEDGLPHEEVPTYFGEERRDRLVAAGVAAKTGVTSTSPEQQAELERLQTLGYIGSDPGTASNASMNLAQRLVAQGRFDEARELFENALKKQRNPRTLGALAEVLLIQRRRAESRKLLDEALVLDPSDVAVRLTHARLLLAEGKAKEAEAAARAVAQEKPDLFHPQATLAMILEGRLYFAQQAGDAKEIARCREGAIAAHQAALRLEPSHVPSLLALAQLILANPADLTGPPRAIELLERLGRLQPTHAAALNNRAIAQLRLGVAAQLAGQEADAKPRLEEAHKLAMKSVEAWRKRSGREYAKGWANAAYALWKLDRMDEAAAAAKSARGADPAYVFNGQFEAALAAAGRALPPPAARPPAPETPVPETPGPPPSESPPPESPSK